MVFYMSYCIWLVLFLQPNNAFLMKLLTFDYNHFLVLAIPHILHDECKPYSFLLQVLNLGTSEFNSFLLQVLNLGTSFTVLHIERSFDLCISYIVDFS
jgi:hypothetical protein